MRLKDFNETFADELRDPDFVQAYLEEILASEDTSAFLLAMQQIIKANEGMTAVASKTQMSRPSLYKALDETGNPEFRTIQAVLAAIGLRLSVSRQTPVLP